MPIIGVWQLGSLQQEAHKIGGMPAGRLKLRWVEDYTQARPETHTCLTASGMMSANIVNLQLSKEVSWIHWQKSANICHV